MKYFNKDVITIKNVFYSFNFSQFTWDIDFNSWMGHILNFEVKTKGNCSA